MTVVAHGLAVASDRHERGPTVARPSSRPGKRYSTDSSMRGTPIAFAPGREPSGKDMPPLWCTCMPTPRPPLQEPTRRGGFSKRTSLTIRHRATSHQFSRSPGLE